MEKNKKSIFENPLLSTKIKSANAKLFPEGALGYFIGPTLALLANSILSAYLNKYMMDVLGMSIWASTFLTLLPIISVITIVIGNILVGRLMDRSRTKAGKARPLLLLAIPLSILALLILFVISPFPNENNHTLVLVLFAIGYNLWFAVAYPFYYTSHAALVNLSTRNSKSRSLLATISNATTLAAMGLTNMVLPFFLNLLFVPLGGGVEGAIDASKSFNNWKVFVIALMVATFIGIVIEYFFTRERITEESFNTGAVVEKKKTIPIKDQVKVCFKDKYWWLIIVFFLLYQFGGMIKNVSQIFYCEAWFGANYGERSATLAIIGAVPTALGMVIAWPLANKIGKGRAIMFGAVLAAIGGAIGFIAPDNFIVVAVSFAVKALGSTPAMYLSLALLADILDHQEAMNGIRTDGLSMTIYGAIMAGMTGIATGVMNGVYAAVGRTTENVASEAVRTASNWLFIGGETICYVAIFILFIFMAVERFTSLDHRAIIIDQRAKAEEEGVEFIDPAVKLKLEEEQAELEADEARKAALKAKCEKKGVSFEEAESEYQRSVAEKREASEAKKAEAAKKREEAERVKAEKLAAMDEKSRMALEEKQARTAQRNAAREAAILAEFNRLREKNGRAILSTDGQSENCR